MQPMRAHAAMGHIADRGARVGELAGTLFLTLAGQILVPSRRERGAVKAAAVVGGQPSAAGGRWQLRWSWRAGPVPVVVSAAFG